MPGHRLIGAGDCSGGGETIIQQTDPGPGGLAAGAVHQRSDASESELDHVVDLDQGEAAHPSGGLIGEWVSFLQVTLEGGFERRKRFLIQAEQEFFGSWGGEDLIEEDLEIWVRDGFEVQGRFAHFADALAQS